MLTQNEIGISTLTLKKLNYLESFKNGTRIYLLNESS